MLPQLISMMWKFMLCVFVFKHVALQDLNFDIPESMVFSEDMEDDYVLLDTPSGSFHPKQSNLSKGVYRWLIKPKNESKSFVTLFFTELYLHEKDKVTVFKTINDSYDDANSLIEPIQAQNASVTLFTDLHELVVKLEGTDKVYQRIFSCLYQTQNCAFLIDPVVHIIHSPIYIGNKTTEFINCKYTYNRDLHHRRIPVFLFDVFNFANSKVNLDGSTHDGLYENNVIEFLPKKDKSALHIEVTLAVQSKDNFRLRMHMVDSACSEYIELNNPNTHMIESAAYALDNGTFGDECRWIVKHTNSKNILGITFVQLNLTNVLDIISINNGASEISTPLLQVTTSNAIHTLGQMVRSSGPYLWISFKPVHYVSSMVANITVHGQGGYFKKQGEISMTSTVGNDTVFLLDVEENNVVLLNMTTSDFSFPATLSIYDGFNVNKKKLLATIRNPISYPILSVSPHMMIIATSFIHGSFNATFKGIVPGCLHMSTLSDENYILSGNCNKTCQWVIPPQDLPKSSLLLNIQYVSLEKDDTVNLYQLDASKTYIGKIDSTIIHVPQMIFSSSTGAMVEVIRKQCVVENKIALVGHSSFIPVCGGEIYLNDSKTFQINSPLHPDTYPVLASCRWNFLATPKNSLIHITFINFDLAPDHCVQVFDSKNNSVELTGSQLPEDMFLSGDSFVYFNSSKCSASKAALQLVSSNGFLLNGTVAECGAVLEGQTSGEFTINSNKSLCIWKVSVPSSEKSVNIISYTVTKTADKGNYELQVYDGPSVRDSQISNMTAPEMWSKRNTLIFIYKSLNASKPSSTFTIKYKSLGCNSSMLCDNKICLHPDWRCNGINDCGDFTDERNCESLPVNPKIKESGYSSVAFWLTVVCMLVVGMVLGFGIPILYQKYANGQYRRFNDISVIE